MTTADDRHCRVRIDPFDRDILKYMLLWGPHGALDDEDVFLEFGMKVEQFRRRFAHLVASYDLRHLDHADRVLVEGARRFTGTVGVAGFHAHRTQGAHG